MITENQYSVVSWCREHYPNIDKKQAILDLFEEATELAAAMNVCSLEDLHKMVEASWRKSQVGNADDIVGEIADVQICTLSLAYMVGCDAQIALNNKMQINRQKTVEETNDRVARKRKLFDI